MSVQQPTSDPQEPAAIGCEAEPLPTGTSAVAAPHTAAPLHPEPSYLVFCIAGRDYACAVEQFEQVRRRNDVEIFAANEEPAPWWGGFLVERGAAVPLINLRALWGYDPAAAGVDRARQTVLLFESGTGHWAFLLDNCLGVHCFPEGRRKELLLSEAFTGPEGAGFRSVLLWQGRLIITLNLEKVLGEKVRQQISSLVASKYRPLLDESQHQQLRRREAELAAAPSVEGYLALAEEYRQAGLDKEAERLIRLAELAESMGPADNASDNNTEFFGRLKQGMLGEVLQVLSRTARTGELHLQTESDTFRIHFCDGNVTNTTSQRHPPGIASLMMALQARQGTYRFAHRRSETVQRLIFKQTETLLMEAAQLIDEAKRNANAA